MHSIAFVALAGRSAGHDLEVEVRSPLASPKLDLDRHRARRDRVARRRDRRRRRTRAAPQALARRVSRRLRARGRRDPARRAVSRSGGAAVQRARDRRPGACSIRSPVAMRKLLDEQLRGEEVFPIGKYKSIEAFTLEWARFETHPLDAALLGAEGAPHGYVRATARIVFDRVDRAARARRGARAGRRAAALPRPGVRARRGRATRVVQWMNAKVDVTSKLATRAREPRDRRDARHRARTAAAVRARRRPDADVHVLQGPGRDRRSRARRAAVRGRDRHGTGRRSCRRGIAPCPRRRRRDAARSRSISTSTR